MASRTTTTTKVIQANRGPAFPSGGIRNFAFGMPMWKLGLAQDILVLALVGGLSILAPQTLMTFQHTFSKFMGWPKSSLLAMSDTVLMLLAVIGTVALGYTVPLYRAIVNNDVDFAVSTAYYHLVVALFGTFLVMTGGTATKILLPFVAHDLLSAFTLFASVPNSSPMWGALSKMHLA